MKYTVTRLPNVDNQLATVWLRSPDRNGVTAAFARIEQELRHDAERKGQPVGELRVIVVDPIAVIYVVSPADCLVTMVWVQESQHP